MSIFFTSRWSRIWLEWKASRKLSIPAIFLGERYLGCKGMSPQEVDTTKYLKLFKHPIICSLVLPYPVDI